MTTIQRTDSHSPEFRVLVALLDLDLKERYGAVQAEYDRFNVIDSLDTVVIAAIDGQAVGCGCFKHFDDRSVEIKRMYVIPEARGKGVAAKILAELESWAVERGYQRAVLETGKKQAEAITLYRKKGYTLIDNYGQYTDFDLSVCFAKDLTKQNSVSIS
jgi:GNAT superfamily N-acetyltransferase